MIKNSPTLDKSALIFQPSPARGEAHRGPGETFGTSLQRAFDAAPSSSLSRDAAPTQRSDQADRGQLQPRPADDAEQHHDDDAVTDDAQDQTNDAQQLHDSDANRDADEREVSESSQSGHASSEKHDGNRAPLESSPRADGADDAERRHSAPNESPRRSESAGQIHDERKAPASDHRPQQQQSIEPKGEQSSQRPISTREVPAAVQGEARPDAGTASPRRESDSAASPRLGGSGQPTYARPSTDAPSDVEHEPVSTQPSKTARPDRPDAKYQAHREELPIDARSNERVEAAVARVMQVETSIRLENASGQSATGEASLRLAAPANATSVNGGGVNLSGEQSGQNLPQMQQTVDEARFSSRVVRGLTAMINQRGGTMTMRLDPPELGQLRVQMTLVRGVVSANFIASTSQAQALLENNMGALRSALESQGLTVERLNVQPGQSSNAGQNPMQSDRQDQQQRQDAADEQSRGRREDAQQHRRNGAERSFSGLVDSFGRDAE